MPLDAATAANTPGATSRELIPLALYALEYPKVPLVLVDFRDTHKPKNREMLRLATGDAVSGVLGVSKFGNWPYLAGSMAWNFVRSRHGDPNNRAARLKAFSQVRRWLTLDGSMDPALRAELQRRLEILGVNPLEESVFEETEIAERQYDALLRYAADPQGLPARLDRDRNAELAARRHGIRAHRPAAGEMVQPGHLFSPGNEGQHESGGGCRPGAARGTPDPVPGDRGRVEPAARRGLEHRRGAPRCQ